MIKRDFYLKRLIHNIFSGEIKVITGICRCGKSVLLFELFYDYLLGQGVREEQILKIELDQRGYYKYRNPIILCEYVESVVQKQKEEKVYRKILQQNSGEEQRRFMCFRFRLRNIIPMLAEMNERLLSII